MTLARNFHALDGTTHAVARIKTINRKVKTSIVLIKCLLAVKTCILTTIRSNIRNCKCSNTIKEMAVIQSQELCITSAISQRIRGLTVGLQGCQSWLMQMHQFNSNPSLQILIKSLPVSMVEMPQLVALTNYLAVAQSVAPLIISRHQCLKSIQNPRQELSAISSSLQITKLRKRKRMLLQLMTLKITNKLLKKKMRLL